MILYEAGQKTKAICENCKSAVPSTYDYRDMSFDKGTVRVKDLLVQVCDQCGTPVGIPAQSMPAIKHAKAASAVPVDVEVPASDIEVLQVAASRVEPYATADLCQTLLAYYLQKHAKQPASAGKLCKNLAALNDCSSAGSKVPLKSLRLKLTPSMLESLKAILDATGLGKAQLVRLLVQEIKADIVTPNKPKNLPTLREVATASVA